MKFKYVGEVEGAVVAYGETFKPGAAVEIKNPALVNKINNNPDFEAVKAKKKAKKK